MAASCLAFCKEHAAARGVPAVEEAGVEGGGAAAAAEAGGPAARQERRDEWQAQALSCEPASASKQGAIR